MSGGKHATPINYYQPSFSLLSWIDDQLNAIMPTSCLKTDLRPILKYVAGGFGRRLVRVPFRGGYGLVVVPPQYLNSRWGSQKWQWTKIVSQKICGLKKCPKKVSQKCVPKKGVTTSFSKKESLLLVTSSPISADEKVKTREKYHFPIHTESKIIIICFRWQFKKTTSEM